MAHAQETSQFETSAIALHHCPELERSGLATAVFTEGMHVWRGACDPDIPASERDAAHANIAQLAAQLGINASRMAFAIQTHTGVVRTISHEHAGEGATRPHTTGPHDALITNEPGVMLCTLEADCLPIYLLDPTHRAIGMVHSGWRGTAQLIGPAALDAMAAEYGTQPDDVLVYFGPSICGTCYEVGAELRDKFASTFSPSEQAQFFKPLGQPLEPSEHTHTEPEAERKLLLDNAAAARLSLIRKGIRPDNLFTCGICTYEHEEFASYRRTGALKERMLTGIMLT